MCLANGAGAALALLEVDAGEGHADHAVGLAVGAGGAALDIHAGPVEAGGDGGGEEGDEGVDGAHGDLTLCDVE